MVVVSLLAFVIASPAVIETCSVETPVSPLAALGDVVATAEPAAPAVCKNLPAGLDGSDYISMHIPVIRDRCSSGGGCRGEYANLSLPMSLLTGGEGAPTFNGVEIAPDCTFKGTNTMRRPDGSYFSQTTEGYVAEDGSFVVTRYVREQGHQYYGDRYPRIDVREESTGPSRNWLGQL